VFSLIIVMNGKEIIDVALKQAKKQARAKKRWKEADLVKINSIHAITLGYLNNYIRETSVELTDFQKKLAETMIDVKEKNNEIQRIKASIRILKKLKDEYEMKLKYGDSPKQNKQVMKEYIGRYSSVVKKIRTSEIDKFLKKLNTLPKIKEMSTIILAGYPNVGKSQFLKTATGHKVRTAPYPFTTKEILIGYVKNRYDKVQLIDTPGLLDRPFEKRNKTEQKAVLALKYLSKNVLFLIDASETCGYSLKEQENLLKEIKKQFNPKLVVIATKIDLPHKEVKSDYKVNATDKKQVQEVLKEVMKKFF